MTRPAFVVALLAAVAPGLAAQRASPRPEWRIGASIVGQTRFLADGNGPTVSGRRTVALEGGPSWTLFRGDRFGLRLKGGVQARASVPRVSIAERSDSIGATRGGGRAALIDLSLRIEPELGGYFQGHVATGVLHLHGPRDVAPFRFAGVNARHRTAELGAAMRLAGGRHWLTASLQTSHLGSRDPAADIASGPLLRAMLGVRRGR